MLSKYLASIFLVLLIIVSSIPVSAQYFGDPYRDTSRSRYGIREESLGVWGVDIEQQSPLVVPAVALEHRSRAPVLLKVKFYPLTLLGGENLKIKDVYVQQVETQRGVNTVRYRELNKEEKETGIVYVLLDRIGVGRDKTPKFDERDVEKACQDTSGKGIVDNIPDQLNLSLRAIIRFEATRPDGTKLDRRDFAAGTVDDIDYEIDLEVRRRMDLERYRDKTYDEIRTEVEKSFQNRVQKTITDVVYFDTVIPIDKSRVYNPSPEKLRSRICGTIKLREKMAGIIKTVEKVETYMTVGCLGSMIGSAVGVLLGMNYCDAVDTISLGCDWVFCPKSKCAEGRVDPFNSIVASSVLCWDSNRKFFGKDLVSKPVSFDKEGKPNDYDAKCSETSGSVTIPTYGCVSGVRGNLQIIDLMIKKYQDCLVAAKTGGVSVGICDRLRNAFICDRAVGVALDIFNGQDGSKYFRGIFDKVDIVEDRMKADSTGEASKTFRERVDTLSAISRNTVEEYERVPFFKMFAQKGDYLRSRICSTLIEGGFFNMKDLKNNLLRVPIPDSYFVLTEKRAWGDVSEDDKESIAEESYSYDVFYQIFSSEGYYERGGNYNIYLKGIRTDKENNERNCRIPIASGFVPAGEMVQENVFRVDACNAEQQCIVFKNKENCNNIDEFAALTPEGIGADPFGLSLLFVDDADNDGLPDAWENEHDLSSPYNDEDKDGYCNAMEFDQGTDPNNKNDFPNIEKWKNDQTECKSLTDNLKKAAETGYNEGAENVNTAQERAESETSEEDNEEEENNLNRLSFWIKGEDGETKYDDLGIEKGGKYEIEFLFSASLKSCSIIVDNVNYPGTISPGLGKCNLKNVELFGTNINALLKAESDLATLTPYSQNVVFTNNEEIATEEKSLLCEVMGVSNPNYFCLLTDDEGKRCSDYSLSSNNNIARYVINYLDVPIDDTCITNCRSMTEGDCLNGNYGNSLKTVDDLVSERTLSSNL